MFGEISPRTKAAAPFISVEEALEETRRGHMVILMDDEERENEGDLSMAAEKATPELINFMAKYARGLICLPMSTDRIDRLGARGHRLRVDADGVDRSNGFEVVAQPSDRRRGPLA